MQPSLPVFIPTLFVVLVFALEWGRRTGQRSRSGGGVEEHGLGAIDGAIYGLMSLMLAFTFSGAAERFDTRRSLITREANAISTLYYRIDLVPEAEQPRLREDVRNYLDARLDFYRDFGSLGLANADVTRAQALQRMMWDDAVAALGDVKDAATRNLVFGALGEVMDTEAVRALARATHPPIAIYYLLVVLVLISSFLAGYEMGAKSSRSWLHMVSYALVMTVVLYIIADLEYPRGGLIRVEAHDQVLIDLRNSMREPMPAAAAAPGGQPRPR